MLKYLFKGGPPFTMRHDSQQKWHIAVRQSFNMARFSVCITRQRHNCPNNLIQITAQSYKGKARSTATASLISWVSRLPRAEWSIFADTLEGILKTCYWPSQFLLRNSRQLPSRTCLSESETSIKARNGIMDSYW